MNIKKYKDGGKMHVKKNGGDLCKSVIQDAWKGKTAFVFREYFKKADFSSFLRFSGRSRGMSI